MHLYHNAVRTGGGSGHGHGRHQLCLAGGVAGVNDDRQVGQIVKHCHGGQIQGIPGGGFEGADAPLAEDDLLIALTHDVFRAHEKLLDGVGQTPLEKNGLFRLAQLLQKVKILHIPGTYLNHVHIGKQVKGGDVHDFRDDGKVCCLLGLQQQPDAFGTHALEGVGRGTGLEGAAPQKVCAGGLHRLGNLHNLRFRLHGAGAGDHGEIAAADSGVSHLDDGVHGVELPVGLLERLGYPLDGVHHFQTFQQVDVHPGGVAHQTQNGDLLAMGNMNVQVHGLQPADQVVGLGRGGSGLQNCNHKSHLLKNMRRTSNSCGAQLRFPAMEDLQHKLLLLFR